MRRYNYPLVGILASNGRKKDTFRGDVPLFKTVQEELKNYGVQSFVFTTADIHESCITGYVYFEGYDRWGKISFPFPDLIYNRISSRTEETLPEFLNLYHQYVQEKKPFFNSGFFDKWKCYQVLSQEEHLQQHLPKTWVYSEEINVPSLLQLYPSLYAKPVNGHQGNGIMKLSVSGHDYTVQTKDAHFLFTATEFILWLEKSLKHHSYIIQEEVKTDKFNGCKYDLRLLCMYKQGMYSSVGVGVRKAAKGSIMTHVPNGGEIIPFHKVKDRCSIKQINRLAEQVGTILTKNFGFIGEFSMDIGLTIDGFPYLFEVNSKPMIFDEKDIQQKRIHYLVELFLDLVNNSNIR